ncbi:hypothetical protein GCM10010340_06370 [Streptomyces griseoloalbus]|nr:hypothetical protein GCM10010340_06370 [Streptomyces albaduncus]
MSQATPGGRLPGTMGVSQAAPAARSAAVVAAAPDDHSGRCPPPRRHPARRPRPDAPTPRKTPPSVSAPGGQQRAFRERWSTSWSVPDA